MEQKNKVRIMHMADVHLDSPFSRLTVEQAEARRREMRGVFTSMILYAKAQKVDIVLIAGDLFDIGYAGEETVSLITKEFERASECKFVIAAGNHDPYSERSVYKLKKFPENVYIFPDAELDRFSFEDLGVDVYGWSFTSESLGENPLFGKRAEQNGNIPLLCAHCDTQSANSPYAPVNAADIERFGAAYSALGHIHRTDGLKKLRSGAVWGYSGCPEGRSYDECGAGGAYIADIERSVLDTYSVRVSFVPFSVRTYEADELDMTAIMTCDEAHERIRAHVKEKKYNDKTSLRLTLRGMISPDAGDITDISASELGLFSLEIKDETSPVYDTARFESDMTLKGAFYRVLAPMLQSEDENERARAAEALRIGFAALEGSDITAR